MLTQRDKQSKIEVFADMTSLKSLLEKYPSAIKPINDEIVYYCKEYSKLNSEQLKVRGFEKGIKRQHLNCINDFVLLVNNHYYSEEEIEKQRLEEQNTDLELISESELENYKEQEHNWLIEKIIPYGISVIAGRSSSYKSFLGLYMSLCLASQKKFLGLYETKKPLRILYLDKENGISILKERVKIIKNGLKIVNPLDIFFYVENINLDSEEDLKVLERTIQKKEIDLIFCDTYRRFIRFKEDSADEVNNFFEEMLKPMLKRTNTSLIFIHHTRKTNNQTDLLESLRGSSDFVNSLTCVLFCQIKKNGLLLKQEKVKISKGIEPLLIGINSEEDSFEFFLQQKYIEEPKTSHEIAVQELKEWLKTKKLGFVFKTIEAKTHLESKKIKKDSYNTARQELINRGIIEELSRGKYKLVKKLKEKQKNLI